MPPDSTYTTKELSATTWKDFERLFAKHDGVQEGCWCMFYHRARPLPREQRGAERNRRDKQALVQGGQSHGVLVFSGKQPVGWCQFGTPAQLARIDAGRNYKKLKPALGVEQQWRITCFFVDREFRHRGVAEAALEAALIAIKARGGGIVEAYPVTKSNAVPIWFGSVGMFEKQQFRKVAPLGKSALVMRRRI